MKYRFLIFSLFFINSFLAFAQSKPKVVTTTTIIWDIARNVAGDKVEVISLLPIGSDPHLYDPTPNVVKKIVEADLVLKNGFHLEGWLEKTINTSGTLAEIDSVNRNIEAIRSENYNSPDPHMWTSVKHGKQMVRNIQFTFSKLWPEFAHDFDLNAEKYLEQLDEIETYIQNALKEIPIEKRILITTHDAFQYYAQEYDIRVESVLGTSTDADYRMEDVKRVREVIKQFDIPAIFVESTINPKLFELIAQDLNIVIGGELFADSIGDEDSEASSYLEFLKHNTDAFVDGILGRKQKKVKNESNFVFVLLVMVFLILTFFVMVYILRIKKRDSIKGSNYTITVEDFIVSYDRKTVLSNINLNLDSGKLIGIIGPNGSGKSSLLKGILGLIDKDAGEAKINGKPFSDFIQDVAYIPQKEEVDLSFPTTVIDVVLQGRYPFKKIFTFLNKEDYKKAEKALELVDMLDYKKQQIGELSGGQQQRVFLARALCQEAEIYLMDEPFVGVDITTEEKMIDILKDLVKQGKTVLVVHHDLSDIHDYFDNLIMLNQRLIACGPTHEVYNDVTMRECFHAKPSILNDVDEFN